MSGTIVTHLALIRQDPRCQMEGLSAAGTCPEARVGDFSKNRWRGQSTFVPSREWIRNFTAFPLKAQVVDMPGSKEHSLRFQSRAPWEQLLAQCRHFLLNRKAPK